MQLTTVPPLSHSLHPPILQDSASNKVGASNKKVEANRQRNTDKSDRATTEQVLDPRTRMIIFKMLNRGVFNEISGCISTGKEANVYFGTSPDMDHDLAIKVFKTSILVFKDRDKYVTGEFRFRKGYNKHNPRKMVKMWAEKEFRNLTRITAAGVPCPKPIMLRSHVLVMTFLGVDGWCVVHRHFGMHCRTLTYRCFVFSFDIRRVLQYRKGKISRVG